jgi:hypothetical protein
MNEGVERIKEYNILLIGLDSSADKAAAYHSFLVAGIHVAASIQNSSKYM